MTRAAGLPRLYPMNRRSQSGFSIIELMTVVIIAAILIMVAIPSFQDFVVNNQLTTQANTLITTLQLARSEAVKRNKTVTVEATDGSTSWGNGFRSWVDMNSNSSMDAGEELRQENALPANTLTSTIKTFQYLPNGFATGFGTSVNFDLCHGSGKKGRMITLDNTGHVSISDTDANCP